MANYKRRFTKEQFKQELFTHLHDMPRGHYRSKKHLEENAAMKAEHYQQALEALDSAADRLRNLAQTHSDAEAKKEADTAVSEINAAIEAYGEASMAGNSEWNNQTE